MNRTARTVNTQGITFYEPPSNVINNTCKMDDCVEAVSAYQNHSYSKDLSSKTDWRRKGYRAFEYVPTAKAMFDKPNSWLDTYSNCTSSSTSSTSNTGASAEFRSSLGSNSITPELKMQFPHDVLNQRQVDTPGSTYHYRSNAITKKCTQVEHTLFELIKAQCNSNPWLMKKVVKWGVDQSKSNRITQEDVLNLSHGRLWITVRPTPPYEDIDDDTLAYLKGAYQEAEQGVYTQPTPQGKEPASQCSLVKDSVGLWVIEKYDSKSGVRCTAAREQPDGRWVDVRNNRTILVKIIPMSSILERLREGADIYQEVETSMEFLFTLCNQKKLNGKLKARNMKHNISILKTKLKKQHALRFAILVANTADFITKSEATPRHVDYVTTETALE